MIVAGDTEADLAGVTSHQLSFAGTTKIRGPRSGANRRAPRQLPAASPDSAVPPGAGSGQLQLHLPGPGRASGWAAHAEPANPALVRMRQIAHVMSQAQGPNTTLVAELDRALVVLLSGHADDQQLRYSQLIDVLHRYGVSISRVAEVLSRGGLLDDDRVPASGSWLTDKLADLAPGIARDVRSWIGVLPARRAAQPPPPPQHRAPLSAPPPSGTGRMAGPLPAPARPHHQRRDRARPIPPRSSPPARAGRAAIVDAPLQQDRQHLRRPHHPYPYRPPRRPRPSPR